VNNSLNKAKFMKNSTSRFILAATGMAALAAALIWTPQSAKAQPQPAPPPAASATSNPVAPVDPATPVKPPPNIFPASPLAQVVRLTQAGVDPSVIMTYITNSSSTFNLDSDKIIYASDAGVPSTMVTAMMQRDQFLQQQFTASQAAQQAQQTEPVQPTETTPPAEPAPADTAEVAAQPDTQPAPVTVNYFNDSLAPYGSWVVVNGYGRCWRPTVCVYNSSWQPYCDRGRWVYSDCGWYWNSEYAWGATFHYGRWFRDASVGWCWYPDTVWAPSWVTWRYSNNYCGWAPLPPRTSYQAGVGIVYNGGSVSVGFGFGLGASCFTFVPTQYFCNPHPRNYCVPPAQMTQVYNNTTVINNYNVNNRIIVNHGIAVSSIAAATRTTIQPVPIHEINAGYALGNYGQPAYRPGQTPGAYHSGYYGNSSLPVRTFDPAQNHFSPPTQSWNMPQATQPQRNMVVATIPQRQMPAANYDLAQTAPAQAPPANLNSSQPTEPTEWQPARSTVTPRNLTHNYGARQNYSAPQHLAPANAPASSPGQQGGYHGGNQSGPGH
jgi:hypothetical protein